MGPEEGLMGSCTGHLRLNLKFLFVKGQINSEFTVSGDSYCYQFIKTQSNETFT